MSLLPSPFWKDVLDRMRPDEESLTDWLSSHPLMKGVVRRDIRHFAALLHRREYDEGEDVFRQGEIGSGFFLLRSGTVRISMDDRQGHLELALLTPGSLLGEMGIFDSSPRSASARAMEPSVLFGLFEGDLDQLQATRPNLAASLLRNLGRVMALRLKEANDRMRKLESRTASEAASA